MPTYFLSANASDLAGAGDDFDAQLIDTAEGAGSYSFSFNGGNTNTSFAFTNANCPMNADWETGVITVEVNVLTANANMTLDLTATRVNSAGAVQESSGAAGGQVLDTQQVYDFTIPSTNWTPGAEGDRIRIDYAFTAASHGGQPIEIETGTTDTEHVTVITEGVPPTAKSQIIFIN